MFINDCKRQFQKKQRNTAENTADTKKSTEACFSFLFYEASESSVTTRLAFRIFNVRADGVGGEAQVGRRLPTRGTMSVRVLSPNMTVSRRRADSGSLSWTTRFSQMRIIWSLSDIEPTVRSTKFVRQTLSCASLGVQCQPLQTTVYYTISIPINQNSSARAQRLLIRSHQSFTPPCQSDSQGVVNPPAVLSNASERTLSAN